MKEYREGMIISIGKGMIERITPQYVDVQVIKFINHSPIIRIDRREFDKEMKRQQRKKQKKARKRKIKLDKNK